MVVKCRHCNEKFEISESPKPSTSEKIRKKVFCAECGKENYILWPKDLNPFPRKYQEA
jgi:hypothetical protein